MKGVTKGDTRSLDYSSFFESVSSRFDDLYTSEPQFDVPQFDVSCETSLQAVSGVFHPPTNMMF